MGQAKILYCQCAYAKVIPEETHLAIHSHLDAANIAYEPVADLCRLAAKRDPSLKQFAANSGKKVVLACYPRAVNGLFNMAGVPLPEGSTEIINLRTSPIDKVAAILSAYHPDQAGKKQSDSTANQKIDEETQSNWLPWFPVIDSSRCIQCMQCLSFCLFGVYGVDADNKIVVQNPEQCKPNCPACSRVCPEAAIIFPKYAFSPINGDEVQSADAPKEKVKVDLSTLLSGDIYQILRDRSRREQDRFSPERNPNLALEERRKCMAQLAKLGDIPAEVIMSLPSPDEIQRRAQEAAAKAKAVLKAKDADQPPVS
jgi:NAD-dependent dihydropyrimidine dehydrogenase PreA subunit